MDITDDGKVIREPGTIYLDDLRSRARILTPEEINSLYTRVCELKDAGTRSGEGRVAVQALEIAVGKEFKDTKDLHDIMAHFFMRTLTGKPTRHELTIGSQLRRKRRALSLSQHKLAHQFGVTQPQMVRYEQNIDPPPQKVLEWLNGPSV